MAGAAEKQKIHWQPPYLLTLKWRFDIYHGKINMEISIGKMYGALLQQSNPIYKLKNVLVGKHPSVSKQSDLYSIV